MEKVLDKINCPADLKGLPPEELIRLAGEIRQEICEVISVNGGHLASSLGVVDLTIALHAIFDCPKDKIVWDVGHQSYAHKMLTGRRKQFSTIRTEGGISGFPRISESEYDSFGTGHAATSISAALGYAASRDIRGTDEKVVVVVGDGSMTNGLCFEGLNNAGGLHSDMLVVLNDNKMSISSNVGAVANYLTHVISAEPYNKLKKDIWELTGYLPAGGQPVRTILNRLERSLKTMIVPGSLFENLGFRYFGPVDGHDIPRLTQILTQLKKMKGPILLHVYTKKGKGYCFAENDATKFHGISAFELKNGEMKKTSVKKSYSEVYGDTLLELGRENKKICAITAAMKDSTGLCPFAEELPERFFDVGIAEGHAVTFAAGLAAAGMKPFVVLYSSFLQRSYDNIVHDVALQKLPVVIAIDRAGFVGEDGPTHHGVFDFSFLRHIPDLVVMAPKDENELRSMMKLASEYDEMPSAIRYPRGSGTSESIGDTYLEIEIGKAEFLKDGADVTILAIGEMAPVALSASCILKEKGIDAGVVNMRFVSPLDTVLLDALIEKGTPVVTLEENVIAGGFGSGVMEYFSGKGKYPKIALFGIPDTFVENATRKKLLSMYGLDDISVAERIRELFFK